ncbi:DUF5682 family protein [Roseateles sp. LYH14W]|uniref:DUF5682 family protein n=1 Tax=Pelomonas parva TaxID=3299032 RepID=A0ABW7F9A0_9BURK
MEHFFGIRHHGPGCARSLVRALDALKPDCVLIEGPPEAEGLLGAVLQEGMTPPVALLSYAPDEPGRAVYHPFAEFSPEWQALRWAATAAVPARFIDLPVALSLGREREDTELRADPLSRLAEAAGYADGEAWWNDQVEERGDGEQLFSAIAEAMNALRADAGESDPHDLLREAHMRQCLRAAKKEGFERIAVVCGAWHLPALQADVTAKADAALLKDAQAGQKKLKIACTWVPWTYRHLTRASGYGAGIASPGWYEHLWASTAGDQPRAIGWLARVATLMRARDLDCSSAHLIEAARLADTLAALRGRPAPGLEELHEATRTVLTLGDDTVLRFVADALVVGDRFGQVPADVPTVPLQRDLEQAQKSLRLKAEALQKTLDLDLRQNNDLARSHLLHRLQLLELPWGAITRLGRSARGSFHEVWTLQWQPEFALRLIEASRWGQTVAQAATNRAIERSAEIESLAELSALVDRVLLADLEGAVAATTRALEDRAALTGDAAQLLAALPSLANVFRYGNVRQTDAAMVGHLLDSLILRAALALPLACTALDTTAAEALREHLLAGHAAVGLRAGDAQTAAWRHALEQLAGLPTAHELLQGLATRLLLDGGDWGSERVAQQLSLHLSSGAPAADAAAWLDGFLNRNAVVLLHDDAVWRLVDDWLAALSEDHFISVLPLVRRSFSHFAAGERRDLGTRAARGAVTAQVSGAADWDEARALLPLPLLRRLLELPA